MFALSSLDDPVAWGILPTSYFLNPKMLRWTLGAADIMFTNPCVRPTLLLIEKPLTLHFLGRVLSSFFRAGQVLETFRGKGVHQPAVDNAIRLLDEGHWVGIVFADLLSRANDLP
jgi:monolysocardiolipin acyltransferase